MIAEDFAVGSYIKSPRSYGRPPNTADTIVTAKMSVRNDVMREMASLRQENKQLKTKVKDKDDEILSLR